MKKLQYYQYEHEYGELDYRYITKCYYQDLNHNRTKKSLINYTIDIICNEYSCSRYQARKIAELNGIY